MVFLFLWLLFSLICARFLEKYIKEPFVSSDSTVLSVPFTTSLIHSNPRILNNGKPTLFPSTETSGITNNSAYDIWWHYPVFKVGSFAQITNNLKYPNNPDEGTCMPASMCGSLYLDKLTSLPKNEICPLPPVQIENPHKWKRVNYFFGRL